MCTKLVYTRDSRQFLVYIHDLQRYLNLALLLSLAQDSGLNTIKVGSHRSNVDIVNVEKGPTVTNRGGTFLIRVWGPNISPGF